MPKPKKKKKKKTPSSGGGAAGPSKVRIRTYRHGLGDCHLLRFFKPDGSPFHMLIDCGVVNRTPDPGPLMTRVAQDIASETGGVLDVVIATHQHTDHLSGFKQAATQFNGAIKMKRLWLAWTEDPSNPLGKKIQSQLVRKLAALRAATAKLRALSKEDANFIESVLDFAGPAVNDASSTQAILDALQKRAETQISYYNPGDGFPLPEVPNVRVYVLGPPTDPARSEDRNDRRGALLSRLAPARASARADRAALPRADLHRPGLDSLVLRSRYLADDLLLRGR